MTTFLIIFHIIGKSIIGASLALMILIIGTIFIAISFYRSREVVREYSYDSLTEDGKKRIVRVTKEPIEAAIIAGHFVMFVIVFAISAIIIGVSLS